HPRARLGRPADARSRLAGRVNDRRFDCPCSRTAALISFGSYARRVDMQGTVLPSTGLIAIAAPSSGWIAALSVTEGQYVDQGTLLYTLDVETATKGGGVQQLIANVLV